MIAADNRADDGGVAGWRETSRGSRNLIRAPRQARASVGLAGLISVRSEVQLLPGPWINKKPDMGCEGGRRRTSRRSASAFLSESAPPRWFRWEKEVGGNVELAAEFLNLSDGQAPLTGKEL